MIKLIASDMDGSLLDDEKNIPKNFFQTLDRLLEKGVHFVAASGRSYPKMKRDFKEGLDRMFFICDNGAVIVHKDKVLHKNCIDADGIRAIVEACEPLEDIMLVLCGEKGAWHLPTNEQFEKHLDSYYIADHVVDDLREIDDEIFKIAICDLQGSAKNSYPVLNPLFGDKYSVAVSGPLWMDIMNSGVNKGVALAMLQEKLGVAEEKTMAFGDFYNDIELLKRAGYSFVMENANEDMRQYGAFVAPSNQENGVMRVIEHHIFGSPTI